MTTNLTNITISESYDQLLHLSDGPTATEKVVHSGVGVATALRVATGSVSVGNVRLSTDTISTINTDTDLNLSPNGTGVVNIARVGFTDVPQARTALGLGSMATQAANDVNITGGAIADVAFTGSFTGITLIESDTFSTVNGNPDGFVITENRIEADGTATDIDVELIPKGSGQVLAPDFRATSSFGYAASTYQTVTQATSKSTAVTLNSVAGRITMNDANLTQNSAVTFTLDNTELGGNDLLIVNIAGGGTPGSYTLEVCCNQPGSALLKLRNMTNGALAEPVEIIFAVLKVS